MQTRFEHFAATSMLGSTDAPPRANGALLFDKEWEGRAFGMAIALSKEGHYEWEDFRQGLIASIAEWEAENALDNPNWDYYQRWLLALERMLVASAIVNADELQRRTAEQLHGLHACASKSCV